MSNIERSESNINDCVELVAVKLHQSLRDEKPWMYRAGCNGQWQERDVPATRREVRSRTTTLIHIHLSSLACIVCREIFVRRIHAWHLIPRALHRQTQSSWRY
ncbi:hypothetical protein PMIN03_003541 [Paraphaeosphaeria minitans]